MDNNRIWELIKNKDMQQQFIRYLLIGGSTAAFELVLYTFLRRAVYLGLALSNIIAVVAATLLNFVFNRHWSFKASSNLLRSLMLYLILFFLNIFFSTSAIILMTGLRVPDIHAKLLTMMMITLWNFILYRRIVFK